MKEIDTYIEKVTETFVDQLSGKLIGVYLHGSLAFGCFRAGCNDIDILAVISEPMTDKEKRAMIDAILRIDRQNPAQGIEMSVVLSSVCKPFVYPTPYELHYSRAYTEDYMQDMDGCLQKLQGTDPDLAAHVAVLHATGKVLHGQPIAQVLDPVPRDVYIHSIWLDIQDVETAITQNPVYCTLNLCRAAAFCEENRTLSKADGGRWALEHIQSAYHTVIEAALRFYTNGDTMPISAVALTDFARHMLARIRPYIRSL